MSTPQRITDAHIALIMDEMKKRSMSGKPDYNLPLIGPPIGASERAFFAAWMNGETPMPKVSMHSPKDAK